ncbi:unnamed protein product [Paramecium octaurelia]|uniref:PH domain-containing protein n=1 Tax=Paramecium octaurelia TaxID=43137 RepID=A0A8S1X0U1_PAROT|nr:unnamed protein product [Paramecium octaurelia]
MNQEESIACLYKRFQKFQQVHPQEISENVIEKVESLYQDLAFDKDLSKLKVSRETKEKIFRQTILIYMSQPKKTGSIDIKMKDESTWKTRKLTIDIDLCELIIVSDKEIILNLRFFEIQNPISDNKRFKFLLQHRSLSQNFWFADDDKNYVNQWFNDIKQCVYQGRRGRRYETMTVEPLAKDINLDLLKQMDRERPSINQNLFYSQDLIQQKHYSINEFDNQQAYYQGESKNETQIDKERIIFLQQPLGESAIFNQNLPIHNDTPIELPELTLIFKDLKYKLSYDYLMDESDFNLYLFEDSIRIMQNKNDCYNFRIFLPITDATTNSLILALYDTKTQTKWNKQIKNIEQLETLGSTTIKIKETREPFGYFYKPRTFNYVRQFYCNYNEIYVIDKSDDKGNNNIHWNICAVFISQHTPKLFIVDTKTINGGYMTQYQDLQLTIQYLKEYVHLIQYVMELKLQKQAPQFILDLINIYESRPVKSKNIQQLDIPEYVQTTTTNNYMHKSQPQIEQEKDSELTRQDSISYLQIKQKYQSKFQNYSDSKQTSSQQISDEVLQLIRKQNQESIIKQNTTIEQKQILNLNVPVHDQIIDDHQNQSQKAGTIEDNKQAEDIEEKKQINVDNQSEDEIEIDEAFMHEDIRPEWEKSQLIQNQDEFYKELLDFVLRYQMWNSQLHPYTVTIKDDAQHERINEINGQHFFYRDEWQFDTKKGYLKFINTKKLEAQKKVFKYILSKMGSNLLKGKSILSVSLPVYVFEKRTNLQRFGDSFAYAPHFLENVPNDPVQQMGAVIAFSLSFTIVYLNLEKPFNPILGETCQLWIKGCPVYLEQISHHPPIAAFIMYGRGYKIYGNLESTASIGANTVTGGNEGRVVIEFSDAKIEYSYCKGYVTGITYGDRYFYTEGQQLYVDHKNQIMSELYFNPQKKGKTQCDYFEGKIYKVNQTILQKYKKDGKFKMSNQQAQVLAEVEGNWQQEEVMKFNGKTVFNLMKDFPFKCKPERFPLASDSQYREDLIGWQLDDFDLSMKYKEVLEERQRKDRKLRK